MPSEVNLAVVLPTYEEGIVNVSAVRLFARSSELVVLKHLTCMYYSFVQLRELQIRFGAPLLVSNT